MKRAMAVFGWVGFFLIPAAAAAQEKPSEPEGEVLYNGIRLPSSWPPKRTLEELRSGKPMEVPYLKKPPSVVAIDVGRQLFVDDFLIESTTLTRTFHKPVPYAGNPILRPSTRWEKGVGPGAMCFSDGVFFDPREGLFKMWYRYSPYGTALATSKDGIVWKRPAFEDGPQPGTNIVLLAGHRDSAVVWLDHDAADPAQRFKLYQFHRDAWRGSVHVSPDGTHWSAPVWCGISHGDRTTMFYNPFRKVWVFSLRSCMNAPPWQFEKPPYRVVGRCRRYWESKDFLEGSQWKGSWDDYATPWPEGRPQFWLACDALDDPPQGRDDVKPMELYNFDAAPYESIMLGLCSVLAPHKRAAGRPKLNAVMLAFSRDGYHFDRSFRQPVMESTEDVKAWNAGNVQSVAGGGLIVGDKFYMYASGRNAQENTTGLYMWRRDGFASVDAGPGGGTLTTRPLTFSGRQLFVNVAAGQGELFVELLDRNGRAVAASRPLKAIDATLAKVEWADGPDLSKWSGEPMRFRFSLRGGALYAFWVSLDESAASRGYVAGGGPGFTGATDTVGVKGYEAAARMKEGSGADRREPR